MVSITPHALLLSSIVAAGGILRAYGLNVLSVTDDEIYTFSRIDHPFVDMVCRLAHSEFPPLHYVFLKCWTQTFGSSVLAIRVPSAIFSTLTIIVIYQIGKQLFSRNAGLIAAMLLGVSHVSIFFAQHGKMYALFWFLSSLSFLYYFRAAEGQRERAVVPYLITTVLTCYTLYTGVLLWAAQNIMFILMEQRDKWRKWFAAQAVIAAALLPWLILFLTAKKDKWCLRDTGAGFDYARFFGDALLFFIGSSQQRETASGMVLHFSAVNCFLYVVLILSFVVGLIFLKRTMPQPLLFKQVMWLLGWILIPTILFFVLDRAFIHTEFGLRYIGYIQIPIILLASGQIDRLNIIAKRLVAAVMLIIAISNTASFLGYAQHVDNGLQKPGAVLTREVRPGDVVLTCFDPRLIQYHYHGGSKRFFQIFEGDLPRLEEYFQAKGISMREAHSIFIMYRHERLPALLIKGYTLADSSFENDVGFWHYRREENKGGP